MKKLMVLAVFLGLLLSACESIEDDARRTPIGTVLSGETTTTRSYVDKVEAKNRKENKDVWRPEETGF